MSALIRHPDGRVEVRTPNPRPRVGLDPEFPHHDENGVDRSLIREQLKLSPAERIRRLERWTDKVKELRRRVRRVG